MQFHIKIAIMCEHKLFKTADKKRGCIMAKRKTRSDCQVGTFEKKHGLPPGTIRNKDGKDTRSDKLIGTIRRESEEEEEKK